MLPVRWHKVIRDLWSNKTRTILIILSIAVGIFAFGSVFITQDVLISDMTSQYKATRPAPISIWAQASVDDLVKWAMRQDEVTAAEARGTHAVILLNGEKRLNLDLYASDRFADLTVGRVNPERGSWPPERGEIVLERRSQALIGTRIGDDITIEAPGGRKYQVKVTGTAHDLEVFPANMFPQLSGYVTLKTAGDLGLPSDFHRLDVEVKPDFDSKAKIEVLAASLKERLQDKGVTVGGTQAREPGEHWGKQTTASFSMILTVIGFFSLILSGFLVVNTVTALLADQKRQIGIMKAVGGTGGQIIGIYLSLVSVYGILALALALPVGLGLAYIFCGAVTGLLNIDIINFHLPARVLFMQAIAALAVPVVASILPILGGVRVTTREAISNQVTKPKADRGIIARVLLKLRFLPRPLTLSLRNTFRRKGRLTLSLGSLALAGTLFITVINVRSSLTLEMDNILNAVFNYDIQLNLNSNYERLGVERKAESIAGVLQAEGRSGASAQVVNANGSRGNSFFIVGVPEHSDFVRLDMRSGRWVEASDRNDIVISSKLASEVPGLRTGDTITLAFGTKQERWTVTGIAEEGTDRAAYASFDYLTAARGMDGTVSTLLVRIDPGSGMSQEQVAQALQTGLKQSGIGVVQTMTKDVIVQANASQFNFLIAFLLSMAAMTALIGALGLAGMMSLNVMERTREIGIMRSIGASTTTLGGIVSTEGMLVGTVSWMIAVPLSIPFGLAFDALLGQVFVGGPLPFAFSPVSVISWLAIVLLISLISSLMPAWRAGRMSIRETLAYE
jgi:putative ABC transport system permease protein